MIAILLTLSSGIGVSFVFIETARNLSIHVSEPQFNYKLGNQSDGYDFLSFVVNVNFTIENNGRAKVTSILATLALFFTSNITHERISLNNDTRSLGSVNNGEIKTWAFSISINQSFLGFFKEPGVLRIDFLIDAKVSFIIQTAVTYLIPIESSWDPPN